MTEPTCDKYGRWWYLPEDQLCPECGQPDSCGDCNHEDVGVDGALYMDGKKRFAVVALDETVDWGDPDIVKRAGGRIWSLYVCDLGERTYACEVTPSYYLEPVGFEPTRYPEDENERDALSCGLLAAFSVQEPIYVHCHRIDALPASQVVVMENDADYDLDAAREHASANGIVPEAVWK